MTSYVFETNIGSIVIAQSVDSIPAGKPYIEVEDFDFEPGYIYHIDWENETLIETKLPDPEPEPTPEPTPDTDAIWAQLAQAIKEGVNEV